MSLRPFSATILGFCGAILMVVGLYFVFVRAPLLPEDLRYMGASQATLQAIAPSLMRWTRRVFWVMGGYMIATGLLTSYVATTAFRTRANGAVILASVVGLTSIGSMTFVNFIIGSDFRWALLSIALLWAMALVLYRFELPCVPDAPPSITHE